MKISVFQQTLKLNKSQQAIYSTYIVEGEVYNGGFNQFYINSSKQYAEVAVEGFKTIKAYQFSKLMEEVNRLYKIIKSKLEKFDDGKVESFTESYKNNPLNEFDNKFYDLEECESLFNLRVIYIRDNINDFVNK